MGVVVVCLFLCSCVEKRNDEQIMYVNLFCEFRTISLCFSGMNPLGAVGGETRSNKTKRGIEPQSDD